MKPACKTVMQMQQWAVVALFYIFQANFPPVTSKDMAVIKILLKKE
jgi:hypothetical protein